MSAHALMLEAGLPNDLMERIRYIELYTSRAVREARLGDYKSRIQGHGFDFDQHKRYQHGDDFRQIDWNVVARSEEVFVKKHFEEKELSMLIIADISRSMHVGTSALSKREMLFEISAALSFSAAADNIPVGLLTFAEQVEEYLAPRKGRKQALKMLHRLWASRPETIRTDLNCPLEFVQRQSKKSAMMFYLSDFASAKGIFESPYLKILIKKHDLVPMVIEDRVESYFPGVGGFLRLKDVEQGQELVIRSSPRNQETYRSHAAARRKRLEASFYHLGLDHLWLQPDQPYLDSVLRFFLNRKRRH